MWAVCCVSIIREQGAGATTRWCDADRNGGKAQPPPTHPAMTRPWPAQETYNYINIECMYKLEYHPTKNVPWQDLCAASGKNTCTKTLGTM